MIENKWKLIAFCVKAVVGVLGTALVLTENHPYFTLAVLSIGAVTNEIIDYYKLRK